MYLSSSSLFLIDSVIKLLLLISGTSSLSDKCSPSSKDSSHTGKNSPRIQSSVRLDGDKYLVQFHCTAEYPIHWIFDRFPEDSTVWNVTYLRDAESILKKSSYLYNSTLTLLLSNTTIVDHLGPSCSSVYDVCKRFTRGSINSNNTTVLGTSNSSNTQEPRKNHETPDCSVDLWYDPYLQIYVCKIANGTVLPQMSNKYCANPTECGMFRDKAFGCPPEPKPPQYVECFDAGVICATLNEGIDSNVPSIVSCWDGQSKTHSVPVSVLDFPEINIVMDNAHSETFDGPHGSRLELRTSTKSLISEVPFDVECTAPYFHFATGLHLTLKLLERLHVTEIDVGPCPGNITFCHKSFPIGLNVSVQEDMEIRNQSSIGISEVPVKKILLVRGLTLESGDWEISCYAPVWNTSEWTYKSELFSVMAATLPKFLAGTGTKDVKIRPTKNVTCMARAVPPPKLTWMYDRDRLAQELSSVGGQQDDLTWSILTIPSVLPGTDVEFKCHAENQAGYVEKIFVLNKTDDEYAVITKVAAALVIVLGILVNVLVVYCCWRILYAEKDENVRNMPPVKFLRHLVIFRKCPTLHTHHGHHSSSSPTRATRNGLCNLPMENTTQSPNRINSRDEPDRKDGHSAV